MEVARCPLRRPVSAEGCWLHGCSSFTAGGACDPATRVPVLGAEAVSAPPPHTHTRSPVVAQGTAVDTSLAAATVEKVGWVRQESGSSHTPSCFRTIFRLLCSAGFTCHHSHYTQISAQRGPITWINTYSNK